MGKIDATPIEDEVNTESSNESYIKDLEDEIDNLKITNSELGTLNNILRKELAEAKAISVDIDYKFKYNQLLQTFHTTLEEFLPFG